MDSDVDQWWRDRFSLWSMERIEVCILIKDRDKTLSLNYDLISMTFKHLEYMVF